MGKLRNKKSPMAENLKKELKNRLSGASKVAVLGIGSQLKGDDAGGILVTGILQESLPLKADQPLAGPGKADIGIFIGGTAPENITSEIKRFGPSHIIIIDAADMGAKPGEIKLIDPENIGGISFSTHNLPATMLIEYLKQFLKCEVVIIGIQPKSVEFGKEPSAEMKTAAETVAALILDILE
ncbi:MAG: hydrogenase maturation peptidase HycI [Candidatus Omnitrophota bacterium]|nr:hydrogenase maturation peptidase HycI [Candidatus Omnitrophota bacterium]